MRSRKSRDSGAGMTSPQPIKNRLAENSILQRKPKSALMHWVNVFPRRALNRNSQS